MRTVELQAFCGDKEVKVELIAPSGNAGSVQIIIDHFYHGNCTRWQNRWLGYFAPASEMTADARTILLALVNEHFPLA